MTEGERGHRVIKIARVRVVIKSWWWMVGWLVGWLVGGFY